MEERQIALSIIDSIDTNMVQRTIQKIHEFQAVVQSTLKAGHDYGIIPGTEKPSLLKPGSEKINMMMGITSEYEIMDKVEDYDKGFFAYNVKCILSKNGYKITEGVGNCNSREKKYASQDAYSITNTILKMAKKRAYIDATLSVASLSDIFTQDIDDPDMQIKGSAASNEANKGKPAHEQVLTFGKHKGKTLGQVYKEDRGYFDWLIANNEKMKPFCEEILKTIAEHNANKGNGNGQSTQDNNENTGAESEDGNGGLNWTKFWAVARQNLSDEQIHAEAKRYFNKPNLKSLTEVINTQDDIDTFLDYLRSLNDQGRTGTEG